MNFSTLSGIVGGFLLVAFCAIFGLQDPSLLWDPISLLIVLGGTLAAGLIAFPAREVFRVFRIFLIVMRNEKLYVEQDVKELARISQLAAKVSIKELERALRTIQNPFLRRGVELVVDGTSPEDIVFLLGWRIEKLKAKETAEANVFRSLAAFAPAFGMLGTLFGLVNLLNGLGQDLGAIGSGLAVALMTTLYGIMAANMIFKPIAVKLEHRTQLRVEIMNTVLEGVVMMSQRRSSAQIRQAMDHMTAEHDDELRGRDASLVEPKPARSA